MKKPKVAIIWSKWGPYHYARFKAFVLMYGYDNCIGVELAAKSKTYLWASVNESVKYGKMCHVAPNIEEEKLNPLLITYKTVQLLLKNKIEVVFIPSYSPVVSFLILVFAKMCGIKCIMMNESHAGTEKARGIAKWIKKQIIKLFDSALVGGTPQLKHFSNLGIPKEKIFFGYDVVDNDYFDCFSTQVKQNTEGYRISLGLPKKYILNLGRMVEKKNLSLLIDAYAEIEESAYSLVLIGSGEEEESLKNRALHHNLKVKSLIPNTQIEEESRTVFLGGFRQIEENPIFYTLSDIFVLPSKIEEWGLVVNEAMACGQAILVSETVGCSFDLVKNGINGFHFNPHDRDELKDLLTKLITDTQLRHTMANNSKEIIKQWGCELFANNAIKAIECA